MTKKVTFQGKQEYVTSNPALSELSNKLLRNLEKMESSAGEKQKGFYGYENDDLQIDSTLKKKDLLEQNLNIDNFDHGYHDQGDFEIPRNDKYASDTKSLIDQAQQYADKRTISDNMFVKSDQSIINNLLFDNFNKEFENDIIFTPTKIKHIEDTYLNENFETFKKIPAKRNEVQPIMDTIKPSEDQEKYKIDEIEILKNIMTCENERENKLSVFDDQKVVNIMEVLAGKRVDINLAWKIQKLNEIDLKIKKHRELEKIPSSTTSKNQFRPESNNQSSEKQGQVYDDMENDYGGMDHQLDVIRETMKESLISDQLDENMSIAESWTRLGEKGLLKRLY